MSATVNQTPIVAAPVVASSEKEMKSLPLKYKSMHYALISFIQSDTTLDDTMKEALLSRLPIYGSVTEQANYYESYDIKTIEKDIVKPMIKKQKDDEKVQAKQEAKAAAKKAKDEEKAKAKAAAPPKEPKTTRPKKESKPKPESKPESKPEPESKPNDVVTTEPVPAPAPIPVVDNTPEMVEEAYVQETQAPPKAAPTTPVQNKEEKKEPPKAPKKAPKPKSPKEKVKPIPIDPQLAPTTPTTEVNANREQYMFKVKDIRYWTPDEHFQNGPVFENATDEDGDPAPGIKQVGKYVNGTVKWIKSKK